jgi:rod shape-determining protein MreB and related proteins
MLSQWFPWLSRDLAIDLGTANTLVSVAGEGLILNEPSVVAVEEGSGRLLSGGCAVGHLARQMLGRTPQSISVVKPLAEGVIADFELCEAMLRYFLRKAQRRSWSLRPRVLVAVPGCATPVEKRAVFNSAGRAGARTVYVISEAKASAIGAGLPIAEPVASMICDIGGGTTDVAILSLGEIVASQSIRIAGDAMDRAVVDYLRRHYSLRVGLPAAEALRIEIGSAYPPEEELVEEVRGVDAVTGLPRKAILTSEEIREALSVPLEAILDAIRQTLDECPPELVADLVDSGLVLAGGGALLRGLERFIEERTGIPTRVANDPLTTCARGTLICLEHLDKWHSALESSDEDV